MNNFLLKIITAFLCILSLKIVAEDDVMQLIKKSKDTLKSGHYQVSLSIAHKALSAANKTNNTNYIIRANMQAGVAQYYNTQRQKNKILPYFTKALEIAEKTKQDSIIPYLCHNIGAQYIEIGLSDSVEKYMLKAIRGFDSNIHHKELANIYSVLSEVYLHDSLRIAKSLPYINKAIFHSELSSDSVTIAFSLVKKGLYLLNTKKPIDALLYFNRAKSIYKGLSDTQGLLYTTKLIAWATANKYNPEIIKVFDVYYELRDSIFNEQTAAKLAEYEAMYETERKEQENKFLTQENLIKKQEIENRNFTILILLFFILLIIIFIIWRLNVMSLKKKEQELLAVRKINKEKERISRDLHDNIGSLVSFVSTKIDWIIKNKSIEKSTEEELLAVKHNSREILEGLRETLWTLNTKSISNFELADKIKPYIKTHLLTKHEIIDEMMFEKNLESEVVLNVYRSCQEIINNINKHSKADFVKVGFYDSEKSKFIIDIYDNGIGLKENDFSKSNHYGLRNIKSRLQEANVLFEIDSKNDNGTHIKITVN